MAIFRCEFAGSVMVVGGGVGDPNDEDVAVMKMPEARGGVRQELPACGGAYSGKE